MQQHICTFGSIRGKQFSSFRWPSSQCVLQVNTREGLCIINYVFVIISILVQARLLVSLHLSRDRVRRLRTPHTGLLITANGLKSILCCYKNTPEFRLLALGAGESETEGMHPVRAFLLCHLMAEWQKDKSHMQGREKGAELLSLPRPPS